MGNNHGLMDAFAAIAITEVTFTENFGSSKKPVANVPTTAPNVMY